MSVTLNLLAKVGYVGHGGRVTNMESLKMRELTANEMMMVSGAKMTTGGLIGSAAAGAVTGGLAGAMVGGVGAAPGALAGAALGMLSYSIYEICSDIF